DVPRERIFFMSARAVEDALKQGRTDEPWLRRIEELRAAVIRHVVQKKGPTKFQLIESQIRRAVPDTRRRVDETEQEWTKRLTNLSDLDLRIREHQDTYERAIAGLDRAVDRLRSTKRVNRALFESFDLGHQRIMDVLRESTVSSEYSPIGSPKRHVEDIGKRL